MCVSPVKDQIMFNIIRGSLALALLAGASLAVAAPASAADADHANLARL